MPVIPGTSWAGAFRERFREFAGETPENQPFTEQVFGFVREAMNVQKKSRIYFQESRITGSSRKVITRNSIDRFSAATKDGALYTENTAYNGRCGLDILLRRDFGTPEELERAKRILFAAICDLHRGYLAVGGLTAVGRGLFTVVRITADGADWTEAIGKGVYPE